MLCHSTITKKFNIFYGVTKVKGNRDASFRRAVKTEGARGDSCPRPPPPSQVFDTSVNPNSTRVRGADCAHHITPRPRIFRPSYGPAVLLQNQCVATACRNRISIANPILALALLAFFVPVEMPGTVQWNLGKTAFL